MILHEKRYLIKAMKRNIKYLFDLFFTWLLRELLLFRSPQSFHHSSFVKEVENDQRNDRSQQQIKHADDQSWNQCNVQSKEPHRWRVQDIFQHRHSKQQRNHSTNDVCTSGIVNAFINHQPFPCAAEPESGQMRLCPVRTYLLPPCGRLPPISGLIVPVRIIEASPSVRKVFEA